MGWDFGFLRVGARTRTRALSTLGAVSLLVGVGGVVAPFVTSTASATSAPKTALINADSITTVDGITSGTKAISLEEFAAAKAGFKVTVVTGAAWDAMTAAQFAHYQVLIVGDPDCDDTPTSATSNAPTWTKVVMGKSVNTTAGNRVVIGTDPELHYHNGEGGAKPTNPSDPTTAGAEHLVQDGIAFAGNVVGATGAYFDTSCDDPGQDVSVLNSLSSLGKGFTEDTDPPCGGSVQLIAKHPAFASLTDANIQGWQCSDHITFPKFPADWQPLAVATDTTSHPTCGTDPFTKKNACGESYVLIAGNDIVVTSQDLALAPATGSGTAGGTHTVTATVKQDGAVASGHVVTWAVTGQNNGVAGTCVPASCASDSAGHVAFTYLDKNGVGNDTINSSVTINGTTEHANATMAWTAAVASTVAPQGTTVPPTAPPATVAAAAELPRTGSSAFPPIVGFSSLLLGGVLLALSRRRRSQPTQ
jgi:LPXTG-motif cell wall-anchored protein